jgi:Calcineurin-like phosphoesterase
MSHLFLLLLLLHTSPSNKLPGDLPNPWYSIEPYEKQEQPVTKRIITLLSPTLGHPAVVNPSGKMALWTRNNPVTVHLMPSDKCGDAIPLKIINIEKQRGKNGKPALFRITVKIPAHTPTVSYNLKIKWPDNSETIEPASVRCLENNAGKPFSILFYTDHQLRDPSWKLFKGLKAPSEFPKHPNSKLNISITHQEFKEIELLNPDLVIHLGDLLFGLEFPQEYAIAFSTWKKATFATHFIPGNHDGYATYSLKMPSLSELGFGLFTCKSKLPSDWKNWRSVFAFISCLYSDVKNTLFSNLVADGLVYWRNMWGPTHYSFTKGKFRFIFINTYGGTNKRRHSFSVFMKFKGYFLGAPGVDNYGGYLSVDDLTWIKKELDYAKNINLTTVVLGHHDPRGNLKKIPYHENESFPTSPLGLGHFEEWNFDNTWDSNPADSRQKETIKDNSAVTLLKLLAKNGGYYISGHVHKDGQWQYKKGNEIVHGIKAEKDITFIKVTTAASSRKDDGYWGYRMVTANPDGTINTTGHQKKLLSIPAGNLWVEKNIDLESGIISIKSSLGTTKPISLKLCLPSNGEGYRLKGIKGAPVLLKTAPMGKDDINRRYEFTFTPPLDQTPHESPLKTVLSLKPARGNKSPTIKVTSNGKIIDHTKIVFFPTKLDASTSKDPEGSKLFQARWMIGETIIYGYKLSIKKEMGKKLSAKFMVRDDAGAWSTVTLNLVYKPPVKPRGAFGCGCKSVFFTITGGGTALTLLLFGIFLFLRRRKWLSTK